MRADLNGIAERFAAANDRAHRAAVTEDAAGLAAAEDERFEVAGEFWAAGQELGDLLMLLLRHALDHRPDALRMYLTEALKPELQPLAAAVAKLEGRRA